MKKILSGLVGLLVSVICNAQITPVKKIDTLVISTLKYNEVELEKEDWPLDTIYKSNSYFSIGDKTFDITEVNKWGRNSHYIIVDQKKNDLPMELWMTTGNLRKFTIILFNGYDSTAHQTDISLWKNTIRSLALYRMQSMEGKPSKWHSLNSFVMMKVK